MVVIIDLYVRFMEDRAALACETDGDGAWGTTSCRGCAALQDLSRSCPEAGQRATTLATTAEP